MPGNSKDCRKQGFRCEALAQEAASDAIKHSLLDLSRIWFSLAEAIDQIEVLMALEALKSKGGSES
jgi:hypothetical protein